MILSEGWSEFVFAMPDMGGLWTFGKMKVITQEK